MKKIALSALACLSLPLLAGCDDLDKGSHDSPAAEEEKSDGDGETEADGGETGDDEEADAEGTEKEPTREPPPPPAEPTGDACNPWDFEEADCSDGTLAFCDFGTSTFGECMAEEEAACEPGGTKNLGPHGDEWMQDVCGDRYAMCEVRDGQPVWQEQYCETPLVLSFDGAPVEFVEAEATPAATFDITMQADSCVTTDWPTAATPWLALDRDGDGQIANGSELFGSGTRLANPLRPGDHARDGFAALAELDANGDGVVDAKDPRFGELLLWSDHDADRVSTPGELRSLSASGIESVPVANQGYGECDDRGNCLALGGHFETGKGTGRVFDVYLGCQ